MSAADTTGDASSPVRREPVDGGIDRLLAEIAHQRATAADPELDALRTAILIEDTFGIVLSDEQLDPSVLGDTGALRALLASSTSPA